MSITRVVAAAVPLAVVLTGLGATAGRAAEPAGVTTAGVTTAGVTTAGVTTAGVPSKLKHQTLTWAECFPGAGYPQLQCAGVRVPRDWARPSGEQITIAVSRVKAGDEGRRRGVLFTNPGGPGAAGLTLSLALALAEPDLAAVYDLIGIDPRGVGSSSPVLECAPPSVLAELYALDGRDVSRPNQHRIAELDRTYAETCASAPLTRTVTTEQTVHDVDLVRAVLHERRISYVGFSAGTWLGTWYAARFPEHVDRFLLDGNLDFTSPSYSSARRQPRGFQKSFDSFFVPWTAEHDDVYGLGTTPDRVKEVYEARRAALAAKPLTLADGSVLTASGYDSGIAGALYWTGLYDGLATALSVLERYATATPAERKAVADVFSSSAAVGNDVFWAVSCQDDRAPSYPTVLDDTARFRAHAPLIGANWNVFPCSFWPGHPEGSPVRGEDLPRLLMLNNDADPATPLENARAARAGTPSARLVTVTHQPDHTIYASGDPCVEAVANDWLLNGILPKHDRSCPGLPLPEPAGAGSAPTAASGAGDALPARVWSERFAARHGAARVG